MSTITITSTAFGTIGAITQADAPATLTIDLVTPGPAGPAGPAGPIGPQGPQGDPGVGVPAGGSEGQILSKVDATDYNTTWIDNYATELRIVARNETGATLSKGTVVYINGASGNKPTLAKALATGDATSAQTLGLVAADILNNQNGEVTVRGLLIGVDTSAYAAGTQLYLSGTTAGAFTSTKPVAPIHIVYVGIVSRSHANQGQIEVAVQNGWELGEIHDVLITSPTNGQVLKYDAATDLWKNQTDLNSGVWGQITGTLSAQTDLQNALDGKYSTSNPAGYITSAALTGYAQLSGAAFTGNITASSNSISARRIIGQPNAGVAGVNIGVGGTDSASTTSGDIWITTSGSTLNYRDGLGSWRIIASRNLANTFTSPQTITASDAVNFMLSVTQNANGGGLRIINNGTGNSLYVDNGTPDVAFTVNTNGRVGVGVSPDTTAAISIDSGGIKFNDGTFQTTAATPGVSQTDATNTALFVGLAGVTSNFTPYTVTGPDGIYFTFDVSNAVTWTQLISQAGISGSTLMASDVGGTYETIYCGFGLSGSSSVTTDTFYFSGSIPSGQTYAVLLNFSYGSLSLSLQVGTVTIP